MTERIFVFGKAVWLGLALLTVSAATDAAGPVQRGQSTPVPQAAQATPSQTIDLKVGAQQPLATGHTLKRVAIGDPAVADVDRKSVV